MPFPMINSYALSSCTTNVVVTPYGDDSFADMNGTSVVVSVDLETPVETDKDVNSIKLPVIRFIPFNTDTNEYHPFFIDITNAPVRADYEDNFKYIYTLCESCASARDDSPRFAIGAYVVFNPYNHSDYIIGLTDGASDLTNEQIHACEPWPVPDQIEGGGGGGVEGN